MEIIWLTALAKLQQKVGDDLSVFVRNLLAYVSTLPNLLAITLAITEI